MSVAVRVAASAAPGAMRGARQERHFADPSFALVTDGVDGVAAGIICHHLVARVRDEGAALADALRAASRALWEITVRHADLKGGPGAAAVVAVRPNEGRVEWASVGSGRIFHRHGPDLHLCNDETAWLIGAAKTLDRFDAGARDVVAGDDIVLLSDGASDLREPAILKVLDTFDDPKAASAGLMGLGVEGKPRQDVTVVVMRVRVTQPAMQVAHPAP